MAEERYYDLQCPLCLHDVDISKPKYYRVLAMNPDYADPINERPKRTATMISVLDPITKRHVHLTSSTTVPRPERSWLLHTRCLEFVHELPTAKLYLLIDLVAPTFLSWSQGFASKHGDFHSSWKCQSSETTATWLSDVLPREIWSMVQGYGIARLLFVMRTASQLGKLDDGLSRPSIERFTVTKLPLKGDLVRIHLVNIGSQTYIGHLSDPLSIEDASESHTSISSGNARQVQSLDYTLNGSQYLAVKSDEVGIINIAFSSTEDGPEWVLNNRADSTMVSKIRNARLQDLTMISDLWKCRGIIPSNRPCAEPYFHEPPFPPDSAWVDSGFLIKSNLHNQRFFDNFVPFTMAKYIPFASMTNISFDFHDTRRGIIRIHANTERNRRYNIMFPEPPRRVKYVQLRMRIGWEYPFLQFEINNKWVPTIPLFCTVSQEVLFDNAVGLWWAEGHPSTATHIGFVVSDKMDLVNAIHQGKLTGEGYKSGR